MPSYVHPTKHNSSSSTSPCCARAVGEKENNFPYRDIFTAPVHLKMASSFYLKLHFHKERKGQKKKEKKKNITIENNKQAVAHSTLADSSHGA